MPLRGAKICEYDRRNGRNRCKRSPAIPGQTVIQCYGTGFLYEYVKANERDCILIFGKGKDTRSFSQEVTACWEVK